MIESRLTDLIRFFWALLVRGSGFFFLFLRLTNRRFCNSPSKIIGWHRGYPSYYLLAPPVMSSPAATALVTRVMSTYQWRPLPDLVSVGVTDRCNAQCEYCSFTSMRRSDAPLLSTAALVDAVAQAQELGVSTVNFVGGEPLLRADVTEVIAAVDKSLSQATMFTNGLMLEARAKELARAGLTAVIVSVNAPSAAEHDRQSGSAGSFAAALAGIKAARRAGLLTGISTVARRSSLVDGSLVALFALAKKLQVNDVLVFDTVPTGRLATDRDCRFSPQELRALIELCAAANRRKDCPGVHPYAYWKSRRGIGCGGGVSNFYVSPYGDVCPCDFKPQSVGNLRDEPLHVLWDRFAAHGMDKSSLAGCRCRAEDG